MEIYCDKCHSELIQVKDGHKVTGLTCCSCLREWKIVISEIGNCPDVS